MRGKRRKSSETYEDLYWEAQGMLDDGLKKSDVAKKLHLPRSTITRWDRRFSIPALKRETRGRKHLLSKNQKRRILAFLKSNQFDVYSDASMATHLKKRYRLKCHRSTVSKWRKEFGWDYGRGC